MEQAADFPYDFIDQVLITPQQIEQRVAMIGEAITNDYKGSEKLLILGLLRGSVMFITDLMRKIHLPMTMDFMSVSSYAGSSTSGFVRIDHDHKTNIYGWDVILVDDIVDSGYTIYTVRKLLLDRNPRSLKVDYLGFSIPDAFVVGYGLDIDEMGRNLPYIASVNLDKYRAKYGK
jgi:hypoxanthine phosphoribosyltransferase